MNAPIARKQESAPSMSDTPAGRIMRIVRSLWAAPNSLVGLIYGGVGLLHGARNEWDAQRGILRFVDMPRWLMPTAISLGHVQLYGDGRCRLADGSPAANRYGVAVLIEENLHTHQAEVLGPLYLPLHGLCMLCSLATGGGTHNHNLLEIGPERGRGPWPWSRSQPSARPHEYRKISEEK